MRPTALRGSTRRQPKGMSPPGWAVHGQIPAAPSTQPILELDSSQTDVPLLLRPHVTVEEATVEEAMLGNAGSTHAREELRLGSLPTTTWFATSSAKLCYVGTDPGEEPDIECQLKAKPSPAQGYDGEETRPHRIHREIAWLTWLVFVVYITYAAMLLNMQMFLSQKNANGYGPTGISRFTCDTYL